MAKQAKREAGWLCDGHGHWLHEVFGIVPASEARGLGAPVPDGEQDPVDDGGAAPEGCPF